MQNPGQACGTPALCTRRWWKPSITPCPASATTAIQGLSLNPATAPAMKTAAITISASMTPPRPSATANAR